MKYFLFNVYIQLLLFITIYSQLSILSPYNLVQQLYNRQIEMSYGKLGPMSDFYIRGQLYMETVTKNHDACTPLTGLNLKKTNETIYDENFKILLAYRGTCSFAQKARNAQNAGASMLIVINLGNTPIKNVIFNDDSNDIFIPVTLINQNDGKIIEDYINLNPGEKIMGEVNFSPRRDYKYVDFKFFFSASEPRAYDLLNNMTKYLDSFGSQLEFTPYYVVHQNPYYVEENPRSNINCLSRGVYCYYPKETTIVQEGQKILLEDLRQKCMYNLSKEKSVTLYYEYMNNFGKECINKNNDKNTLSKICSQNVLEKLGYPANYLDKCIAESFGVTVSDLTSASYIDRDNKILKAEYDEILKYKLTSFPAVIINDKILSGIVKEESIIISICENVKIKPSFCSYIARLSDEHRISSLKRYRIIYLLIMLLILVNICLSIMCRKYIIKKINEGYIPASIDIDGRIKQLINNYYDLKRNSNDYKAFESNKNTSSTAIEMQEGQVSTV